MSMAKFKSLVFRELKISRKHYLMGLALIAFFSIMLGLSVRVVYAEQLKDGETPDILVLFCSYVVSALAATNAVSDGTVFQADIASGWSRYSFALPVSAFEKTFVKYAIKAMMLVAGAVVVLVVSSVLYATSGVGTISPSVMFCYFICADLFMIIDIVYQSIAIRADNQKMLKRLGIIAGVVVFAALIVIDLIVLGGSDPEIEAVMREIEQADSPAIFNKYIHYVTIPSAAGIIGIVLVFVIFAAGFAVMVKNHGRRKA